LRNFGFPYHIPERAFTIWIIALLSWIEIFRILEYNKPLGALHTENSRFLIVPSDIVFFGCLW
jgi:hypothetical protein